MLFRAFVVHLDAIWERFYKVYVDVFFVLGYNLRMSKECYKAGMNKLETC